jgi:hypothetical protein
MWEIFVSSRHATHRQTIDLTGDQATPEVYCTGRHLQNGGYAENRVVRMIICHPERYVRGPEGWRMAWRREIVDCTEVETVQGGRRG